MLSGETVTCATSKAEKAEIKIAIVIIFVIKTPFSFPENQLAAGVDHNDIKLRKSWRRK
jgi:hypothetical protein